MKASPTKTVKSKKMLSTCSDSSSSDNEANKVGLRVVCMSVNLFNYWG